MFKRFIVLFSFSLLLIGCLSREQFIEKGVNLQVRLPETDKKFFIKYFPAFLDDMTRDSEVIQAVFQYFGDNREMDINQEGFYIYDMTFEDFGFYTNYTRERKVNGVFVIHSVITFSQGLKNYLKIDLYSRQSEIFETMNDRAEVRNKLINLALNDLFEQLNENKNFQAFLKMDKPEETIKDESLSFANRNLYKKNLHETNRQQYTPLFTYALYNLNIGAGFGLTPAPSVPVGFIGDVFVLGFEVFPLEFFSIEYDFSLYALILTAVNTFANRSYINNYVDFTMNHYLYFNFNFFQTYFYNSTVSLFFMHSMQYIQGSNFESTIFNEPGVSYHFPKFSQFTKNSLMVGLGYNFNLSSPYLYKRIEQFGVYFFYEPYYVSFNQQWYHTIGFVFSIKYKNVEFRYRDKPLQFVKPDEFQKR